MACRGRGNERQCPKLELGRRGIRWHHRDGACEPSVQQHQRVNVQSSGDAFQTLQREVAFASFQSAHVCPVDAHDVGEGFLAEAALGAVGAQVTPYRPLEIAFCHVS